MFNSWLLSINKDKEIISFKSFNLFIVDLYKIGLVKVDQNKVF